MGTDGIISDKDDIHYSAGTRIVYERNFLMQMRHSPLAKSPPANLPSIPGVTVGSPAKNAENGTSGGGGGSGPDAKNKGSRAQSPPRRGSVSQCSKLGQFEINVEIESLCSDVGYQIILHTSFL